MEPFIILFLLSKMIHVIVKIELRKFHYEKQSNHKKYNSEFDKDRHEL